MISLKRIMNEFYARDISKKVRFTVANQMAKGDDKKTGWPLYEYRYYNKKYNIGSFFDQFIKKKKNIIMKKIRFFNKITLLI